MDDPFPQLGLALLLVGVGLPVLTWFVLRFPLTSGAVGLVSAALELFRILGDPGEPVHPSSCDDFTPPSLAIPRVDPRLERGNGLLGPEVRL